MEILKGKHILFVNSDINEIEDVNRGLKKCDAVLVFAVDGLSAVKHINQESFDGIILDMGVKKVAIKQLLGMVKASKNRNAPLFLTTDNKDELDVQKLRMIHRAKVIERPFTEAFVEIIAQTFKELKDKDFFDPRLVKIFLSSIRDVLGFYISDPAKIEKPSQERMVDRSDFPVTGLISFTGSTAIGSISLSLDNEMVRLMMSTVFGMTEEGTEEEMNEIIRDFAGELCNQVLGDSRTKFSKIGLNVELGLPEVVVAKKHKIYHQVTGMYFQVPIKYTKGTCIAEISMTKNYQHDGEFEFNGENWAK